MPERLDHVTFTVPMGTQTISWNARQVLLAKLGHKQTTAWLDKGGWNVGSRTAPRRSEQASKPSELPDLWS